MDWAHCEICGKDYDPEKVIMIASRVIGSEYFTWCRNCHDDRERVRGITMKENEVELRWLRAEVTAIRRALLTLETGK